MSQWDAELKSQIEIQNFLQNIDIHNYENAAKLLAQSSFNLSGFDLIKLAFFIVSYVGICPQKIDLYISLILRLISTTSSFDLLPIFIFRILKSRICDEEASYENSAEVLFYVKMIFNHILSTGHLVSFLNELIESTPQYVRLLFWLFSLSFPILREESPVTYIKVYDHCHKIYDSVKDTLPHLIQQSFHNIDTLSKDDWRTNLIPRSCTSLSDILKTDNLEKLKSYITNPENKFDFNMRITSTIFEPCPLLHSDPTIVQYCAYFGSDNCFFFLVANGADLDIQSKKNVIQNFAIIGGNCQIIEYLIQKNYSFAEYLESIIQYNQSFLFDYLVAVHYSIKDLQEEPIIFKAAEFGNAHVLDFCKKNGFDMNAQFEDTDFTVLQTASYSGQLGILILMAILYPEELHKLDHDGQNLIHYAAELGYWEIIVYLLKENVDPNIVTKNGETALNIAIRVRQIDAIDILLSSSSLLEILETGSKISSLAKAVLTYNNNAVHFILMRIKKELEEINNELRKGSKLNKELEQRKLTIKTNVYDSILLSVKCNSTEIASFLLSNDLNLDGYSTKDGTTALHFAAGNGNIDIFNLLLAKELDINVVDKFVLIKINH